MIENVSKLIHVLYRPAGQNNARPQAVSGNNTNNFKAITMFEEIHVTRLEGEILHMYKNGTIYRSERNDAS